MKQYRITAPSYAEDHIPDAAMASEDLAELKRLAGINNLLETSVSLQQDHEEPFSPVGSNISITGMEKRNIEKQLNIKAGTPEWFKLWFSRPYLTGEKPVGDDLPSHEHNPSYLLKTDGTQDADKVSSLADKLEKKWHDMKHAHEQDSQATKASKPKY